MSLLIRKKIPIRSISPKPEIEIWYCNISKIIAMIFCNGNYHNFRTMGNKLFTPESFNLQFLNPSEMDIVNGFKSLKKQVEWISGRFLIKQLVMDTVTPKPLTEPEVTIAYREMGAPYLTDFPETCISISHSGDITAASICKTPVQRIGLDIETIGKKPDPYFLKTAFTRNEIEQLDDTPEMIFKHWTLKEAFLKYIQKGFNESLHRVEILDGTIFHNKIKACVYIYSRPIVPGYVLSLVSD